MEENVGANDPSILILTNNLTSGAIPHLIVDVASHLPEEYTVYAGALMGGGPDRVSEQTIDELEDAGATPVRFYFDTADTYTATRHLYEFLQNVDILHTHLNRSGVFGRAIGKAARVPIIISTEQNDRTGYSPKQIIPYGLTLPLADHIVCISEQVRESMHNWEKVLCRGTETTVIPNSADPGRVNETHEVPNQFRETVQSTSPLIGTVGRTVPQKNQEVLIRALPDILEHYPDAGLVIVGDGNLTEELQQIANELDVSDSVTITGWLERTEVYSLLQEFDVYAMSSVYEGLGVALLEAMFADCPLVLSDIDIFHEVAAGTAFYAQNDPVDWAETILDVLDNPEEAKRLNRSASERAMDNFSPEAVAGQYQRLYENLIEEQASVD